MLRHVQAGPAPGPFRWTVKIGTADFSAFRDPLPIENAVGPATALIDRIRLGRVGVWIHAAPGAIHIHVVAHRHADVLLARLPGWCRWTGGAIGLLAAMAAPAAGGPHQLDGARSEQSANTRLAALGRATSLLGHALLACCTSSARAHAVARSQGAAILVALEDAQETRAPLLLAALPR